MDMSPTALAVSFVTLALAFVAGYLLAGARRGADERRTALRAERLAAELDAERRAAAQREEILAHERQQAATQFRDLAAEALADGGPDRLSVRTNAAGEQRSLRWILIHMIEEYAQHNGHADLIRESIDGAVAL